MTRILTKPATEEVRMVCPGVELLGDLTVPENPVGLVIFAHGSGSSRQSPRNRQVAGCMHDHGLATLLFDLLTPVEAEAEERGAMRRFDIPFLTNRLVSATRWAREQPALRGLGIGYFGASTGAAAALAAAAQLPEIGAVVSRGGRTDLAGEASRRVNCPVLLIVGSRDVPVWQWNRETLDLLGGERRLAVVEGASHLFPEPGALEEVEDLAADWFALHLVRLKKPGKPVP
jgi:putative phosphoribosyl transferase